MIPLWLLLLISSQTAHRHAEDEERRRESDRGREREKLDSLPLYDLEGGEFHDALPDAVDPNPEVGP